MEGFWRGEPYTVSCAVWQWCVVEMGARGGPLKLVTDYLQL